MPTAVSVGTNANGARRNGKSRDSDRTWLKREDEPDYIPGPRQESNKDDSRLS